MLGKIFDTLIKGLTLERGVLVGGIFVLAPAHANGHCHNEGTEHQEYAHDNQNEPGHVHAKDSATRLA